MARRDESDRASDPTRRQFFTTFGRQTVRNAGAVVGAAAELRRAGGAAARELLDLGAGEPTGPSVTDWVAAGEWEIGGSYRSTYRLGEGALLILDQRDLPGRLTVLTCREPTEVASAIRAGAVSGGPILGEMCAYALVVAMAGSADRDGVGRDQAFRAGANTLRGARHDVHALRVAVDRMEGKYDALTASMRRTSNDQVAAALREEADAIATGAQLAHAALGESGAAAIAAAAEETRSVGESINLLMHADMGPLSCGLVGTGTAMVRSLLDLGWSVHVWLTDAAPGMEGSRIAALQLGQMDVPHTVIPDSAYGWLLSTRHLDAVLLRGDTVCVNGDSLTLIGGMTIARLAADAAVPVHVVAPGSAFDPEAADGRSLVLDLRSPAETAATATASGSRPVVLGARLTPATDIVPAALVTSFLTDSGPRAGGRR